MGLHSRRKGRSFEQLVADAFRQLWPNLTVRRAWQAHAANESDVTIDGHPWLSKLWLECNHSDAPNPLAKLRQAEADIAALKDHDDVRLPIVVWRKSASRTINVTTRMWVMLLITEAAHGAAEYRELVVTMEFYEWLEAIKNFDRGLDLSHRA